MAADEKRHASVIVALGSASPSRAHAVERARVAATPFGASVEPMGDGTIVATLEGKGGARDQARQAARCALALRDVLEGEPMAVATARTESGPEEIRRRSSSSRSGCCGTARLSSTRAGGSGRSR